jgi:hypothetical protein
VRYTVVPDARFLLCPSQNSSMFMSPGSVRVLIESRLVTAHSSFSESCYRTDSVALSWGYEVSKPACCIFTDLDRPDPWSLSVPVAPHIVACRRCRRYVTAHVTVVGCYVLLTSSG